MFKNKSNILKNITRFLYRQRAPSFFVKKCKRENLYI